MKTTEKPRLGAQILESFSLINMQKLWLAVFIGLLLLWVLFPRNGWPAATKFIS